MKLFAVLLGALALIAGFTGGMRAYSASSDATPVSASRVAVHHYPSAQVVRPGPVLRWAPCRKPAVREGKACVTHVTHTIVTAPPVVAAPPAAPATTGAQPRPHATDSPEPTQTPPADDGGDDHGDDHGDDGGGDDGGGDDD